MIFSMKTIASLLAVLFVSISIYIVVEKVSGPDFSGDYVATPGSKSALTGGDIKLPYLKLHLDQSGDSFNGFLDVFNKNTPKIRYDIISGKIDKLSYINLELQFESSVDANASIGGFGISAPFAKANLSMRSTSPVKEDDSVISFEGIGELGGAMGLAMNIVGLLANKDLSVQKKELATFCRIRS